MLLQRQHVVPHDTLVHDPWTLGVAEVEGGGGSEDSSTRPSRPDSLISIAPFTNAILSQRSSVSDPPSFRMYLSRATTLVASRGLIETTVTD